MSHVRIWRSAGVIYFAGQMPAENVAGIVLVEGTFRSDRAAYRLKALAESIGQLVPPPLRDAKDQ